MKFTKVLLLAFFAIVALSSCNQKNANQTQEPAEQPDTKPPANEEPQSEDPKEEVYQVILYKKTPCFGKCPVYEVKFMSDGKVTWYGKMNVERMGWHEANVEWKVIKDIQMKADALGYWGFYEEYPVENKVADLPTTITSVRLGDMIKTVRNTHDAPEKLEEFEKYLSGVIEGLAWRPSTNK